MGTKRICIVLSLCKHACKSVCDVHPGIDPYSLLARSCDRWWPDFVTFTACKKSRCGLKRGKKAQCVSNGCKDLFERKKYFGVRCTLIIYSATYFHNFYYSVTISFIIQTGLERILLIWLVGGFSAGGGGGGGGGVGEASVFIFWLWTLDFPSCRALVSADSSWSFVTEFPELESTNLPSSRSSIWGSLSPNCSRNSTSCNKEKK